MQYYRQLALGLTFLAYACKPSPSQSRQPAGTLERLSTAAAATADSATASSSVRPVVLPERSLSGACSTLASHQKADPWVSWGRHFPVENRGILAQERSPEITAKSLEQRMIALNLREETYQIIDCGDSTLVWLRFDGGCGMVDHQFKELSDAVGPLELVACFDYLWSEIQVQCETGEAPLEKCRYILAPFLTVRGCGTERENERAKRQRLLIKAKLVPEGSRVCYE